MKRLKRWVFLKDESGAVAFLTVAAVVPLALMMFYMVNTAKLIHEKSRTQDAADMIALVHAAEGARSLNTMSMNQVTMTQAFAVGVTASTLKDVLDIQTGLDAAAAAMVGVYVAKCTAKYPPTNPITGAMFAACNAPNVVLGIEVGIHTSRTVSMKSKYKPQDSFRRASEAVRALNAGNREIINRYPEAVSEAAKKIAQTAKVSDIYFDEGCLYPGTATSCNPADQRLGMELPVDRDNFNAEIHFCVAAHVGTGGFDIPISVPGVPNVGGIVMNGSYLKRGFPPFKGPLMNGGKHIVDHVNDETKVGELLEDFYKMAKKKSLNDFFIPLPFTMDKLEDFMIQWPFKQTKNNNVFTVWAYAKVMLECLGMPSNIGISNLPDIEKYHPMFHGIMPKLFPGVDDFNMRFKPLAFSGRLANKRWAPEVFEDSNSGFFAYAQSIIYNPDEIGLYSQNWQAKLIAAKKLEFTTYLVHQRMATRAPRGFKDLQRDLGLVAFAANWSDLVDK